MKLGQLRTMVRVLHELDPNNKISRCQKDSKYKVFYKHILKEDQDEEFYTQLLYNDIKHKKQFNTFKSRFKKRLFESFFLMDYFDKISLAENQSAYISSYELLKLERLLHRLSLTQEAKMILIECYKIALKRDLILIKPLILERLLELELIYGESINNYKEYQMQYSNSIIQANLYYKIKKIYLEIAYFELRKKNKVKNEDIFVFEKQLIKYLADPLVLKSPDLVLKVLTTQIIIYNQQFKLEKKLEILKFGINYLKENPMPNKYFEYALNIDIAISYLNQKKYALSLSHLNISKKLINKKNQFNWLRIHRFIFTSYLLQEDYSSAIRCLHEVLSLPYIKKVTRTASEPFYLFEALIHIMIKTGTIQVQHYEGIPMRAFRLGRFLNEVPLYSQDKEGLNVTINILQCLFLLSQKNYEATENKLNALKQYSYRYLRKPHMLRQRTFIKMLCTVASGHFNRRLVTKRGRPHLKVLLNNPMDYSEQSLSIELISYEKLWNEVLKLLD